MKGAPTSKHFDDIYFSADDGLAETQHVFIEGNDLPAAWEGKESFTVCETGFGTGLNFLALWTLFDEKAEGHQTLDFISFEKYPLKVEEICAALQPWAAHFGDRLERMLAQYPILVKGFHRLKLSERVTLTVIFDDLNEAIQAVDADVDCWFLDGFTPAKNPEMWTAHLYEHMARLSHEGTSLATFTAAGDVRRGLKAVGFDVEKRDGFGRKRDMVVGRFKRRHARKREDTKLIENNEKLPAGSRVAIIGGGLAGTAAAYVLKQYGYEPVIYEAGDSLAAGASGNDCGFYNPRFCALWDGVANFFAPAYAQFLTLAQEAGEAIEHDPCGALHIINAPEKEKRFAKMIENWGWNAAHIQLLLAEEASDVAGIDIDSGALYLPQAGSVSPKKLCAYYAQDIEVHLNHPICDLNEIEADAYILCAGFSNGDLVEADRLNLQTVRGQITQIQPTPQSRDLKCNIHFGDADNEYNLNKIKDGVPALNHLKFEIIKGWAGLRTATPDRFPIVDCLDNHKNIYVSTAYGSHGLVGSQIAAHGLADMLRGVRHALPTKTWAALGINRYNKT